ncbi:MAG: hypothetical protein IJ363_03420 [Clostridia bacterium]|nr:hypothetical protein [Clostridia bacterium]
MRGEVLFEKMTGISDEFIAEAALVAPVGVVAPRKKPFASLSRALNSGWGVACICFIVAIAAVVGMVAWGRMGEAVGPGSDPSVRFAFSYEMTANDGSAWSGTAMPGDVVNVSTTVVNHGKTFVTDDFFAWAKFVLQEDESVVIEGDYPLVESIKHPVKNGDQGTISFHFHIPENATPGVYDLVLSYDGEKQVFGGALTVGDPNARFSFGYKLAGDALTGASYLMDTWITNEGEPFTFEGSSMGFAPAAVLIHMETQYRIDGSFGVDDDQGVFTVNTGDMRYVVQEFFIPADAPTGAYALELSYGGVSKSFPGAVIVTHLVLDYPLLENGHPFSFGYEPFGGFAIPGDRFIMNAWVINEGEPFSFMGDPYSFQPTATLYHMDSDYTIDSLPPPTGVEPRPCNILTGQKGENAYTFPIPADAPTGVYGLKLTYGGAQETFDNVLTVAEPTVIDPAVLYNLTMSIGSDWLYEPIDEAYVDGQEVTVRIKFATDVGTLFILNGEVIDAVTGDDQLGYWEYSFIMPKKDSEIIFHTYDGTAPYGEMLKAFILSNPYLFAGEEQFYYYGEFGDGVTVALQLGYGEAIWSTAVGGYTFVTPNTHDMMAFHNGTLYELQTAYDMGLLTDGDLEVMMATHKEWFPDE